MDRDLIGGLKVHGFMLLLFPAGILRPTMNRRSALERRDIDCERIFIAISS